MRSILFVGLVSLQLCSLAALLQGHTQMPGDPIVNWVSGAWDGGYGLGPPAATRYGRFCCIVEGGLAIGSVETGSHTIFTTADGLLGGYGESPNEIHIDDSGFIWAYSNLHIDDPRLEWQVFDGLRWAPVGDIGQFGIVDNRCGIWSWYANRLAHYRLSPPGSAECIEYYAPDYGVESWPYWRGVDSSGRLWGFRDSPSRVCSFDARELKSYDTPEDFSPSGGAVDRGDNKWFKGGPAIPG